METQAANQGAQVNPSGAPSGTLAPNGAAAPAPQKIHPKVGKNVLTCGSAIILILIVLISFAAWTISKSGLFKVPVFSRSYERPAPTRSVEALPIDPNTFLEILSTRAARASALSNDPNAFRIIVTEEELTGALLGALKEELESRDLQTDDAQIVLLDDTVEFYGRFHVPLATVDVLAHAMPEIEEDSLQFELTDASIGEIGVSPMIMTGIINRIVGQPIESWQLDFGSVTVTDIKAMDGELEVSLRLNES